MRYVLHLVLLSLFPLALTAQPILGSATLPQPGSLQELVVADTVGVQHGSGGIGVAWDYSGLQPLDATVKISVLRPDQVPIEVRDTFPSMDRVVIDDTTTEAFQVNGTHLRMLGTIVPSATMVVAESDPYDVRPVELRFGEVHTDTFSAVITTSAVPTPIRRYGEHRLVYDGFGELVVGEQIYLDCARLTMERETWDTVRLGPVTTVLHTQLLRTTWIAVTNGDRRLEIETMVIRRIVNGGPVGEPITVRSVRYDAGILSSVDDVEQTGRLEVAPHPITGRSVRVLGLSVPAAEGRLVDPIGRVYPLTIGATGSESDIHLRLPAVPSGWYVLEIVSGQDRTRVVARRTVILQQE